MNQATAKAIYDLTQTAGALTDWEHIDIRQSIRSCLAGKEIHMRDCGFHATWDAIHADLQTPTGSDYSMREWAIAKMREIANGSTIAQDAPGGGGGHNRSTDTLEAKIDRQARSANGL